MGNDPFPEKHLIDNVDVNTICLFFSVCFIFTIKENVYWRGGQRPLKVFSVNISRSTLGRSPLKDFILYTGENDEQNRGLIVTYS